MSTTTWSLRGACALPDLVTPPALLVPLVLVALLAFVALLAPLVLVVLLAFVALLALLVLGALLARGVLPALLRSPRPLLADPFFAVLTCDFFFTVLLSAIFFLCDATELYPGEPHEAF